MKKSYPQLVLKAAKQSLNKISLIFLVGVLIFQIMGGIWFLLIKPQLVHAAITSWTQTSQADFQAGTAGNVDTDISPGDIKLGGNNLLTNGGFENWASGMPIKVMV